jgi:hypothetical protein
VAEGGSVVLTGSGSDPDGDPLVYAWDLDNNGTFETAGQNATFSAATLDGPSSATVRLQVCDDNLACDTTSATVTITNVAPQLSNLQVTPAATSEHALATLSGDIVDPGTQDTQTVVISWGDGSTNTTVSLAAGATSFTTQHPYLDDNPTGTPSDTYAISVSVTDKDGGSTTGSTSATVDNVAPTITSFAGTDSLAGALAFTPSTFNGTFTDPGTLDTHTAVLNWGTGEGSTSLALGPNVLALSTTHQFATPGCNKPVAVSVTDDDTGSATQGTTVNVGSGAFLAPMTNQPLTDKLKNGQVLPVKVRITDCSGNPVTNLTPAVRLMDGDQTPLADDGSDVLPIASVSAADTSGWMRLADGNYLYNMKVQVAKLNTDYTVIVYPYANQATGNLNGSLTLRHVIQATK